MQSRYIATFLAAVVLGGCAQTGERTGTYAALDACARAAELHVLYGAPGIFTSGEETMDESMRLLKKKYLVSPAREQQLRECAADRLARA